MRLEQRDEREDKEKIHSAHRVANFAAKKN